MNQQAGLPAMHSNPAALISTGHPTLILHLLITHARAFSTSR